MPIYSVGQNLSVIHLSIHPFILYLLSFPPCILSLHLSVHPSVCAHLFCSLSIIHLSIHPFILYLLSFPPCILCICVHLFIVYHPSIDGSLYLPFFCPSINLHLLCFHPCLLSRYLSMSMYSIVYHPLHLPSFCPSISLYLLSFPPSILSVYLCPSIHSLSSTISTICLSIH